MKISETRPAVLPWARDASRAARIAISLAAAIAVLACSNAGAGNGTGQGDTGQTTGGGGSGGEAPGPETEVELEPGSDPYAGAGSIPEACRGIWFEAYSDTTEYTWYIMANSIRRVKHVITYQNYLPVAREVKETLDLPGALSGTTSGGDSYEISSMGNAPVLSLIHTVAGNPRSLLLNSVPREGRSFTFRLQGWDSGSGRSRALGPAAGVSLAISNALNGLDLSELLFNEDDGSFTAFDVAPGESYLITATGVEGGDSFVSAPVLPLESAVDAGTVVLAEASVPYSFKLSRSALDPALLRRNIWANYLYSGRAEGEALVQLLELSNVGEGSSPSSGVTYEIVLPEDGAAIDAAFSPSSSFPVTIVAASGSLQSLRAADASGAGARPARLKLKVWGVDTKGAEYVEQTLTIRINDAASGRYWEDSYSWRVYRESMRLAADGAEVSATKQPEGLTAPIGDRTVVPKSFSGSSYLLAASGKGSAYRVACGEGAPFFGQGYDYWFNNVGQMSDAERESLFGPIGEGGAGDDSPDTASILEYDSEALAWAAAGDMDYYLVADSGASVGPAQELDLGPLMEAWRAAGAGGRFWKNTDEPSFAGYALARPGPDRSIHAALRVTRSATTLAGGWGTEIPAEALVYARLYSGGWSGLELVRPVYSRTQASEYPNIYSLADLAVGPDGSAHLLFAEGPHNASETGYKIYYTKREPGAAIEEYSSLAASSAWSAPELVENLSKYTSSAPPRLFVQANGELLAFLPDLDQDNVRRKSVGGMWEVAAAPNNWRWSYCDLDALAGGGFVSVSSNGGTYAGIEAERVTLGAAEAQSFFGPLSAVGGSLVPISGPYHVAASPLDDSFALNWNERSPNAYILRSIVVPDGRVQYREKGPLADGRGYSVEGGFQSYGDRGGFYSLSGTTTLMAEGPDRLLYRRVVDFSEGGDIPASAQLFALPPIALETAGGGAEVSALIIEIAKPEIAGGDWGLKLARKLIRW